MSKKFVLTFNFFRWMIYFLEILVDGQDVSLSQIDQFYRGKINTGVKLIMVFIFMTNYH